MLTGSYSSVVQRFLNPLSWANPTLSAYREGLSYRVSPAEQGKPVFLPFGKGHREMTRWECGQQRKEKAKAAL
jgi:hypothetical protein